MLVLCFVSSQPRKMTVLSWFQKSSLGSRPPTDFYPVPPRSSALHHELGCKKYRMKQNNHRRLTRTKVTPSGHHRSSKAWWSSAAPRARWSGSKVRRPPNTLKTHWGTLAGWHPPSQLFFAKQYPNCISALVCSRAVTRFNTEESMF